MTDEPPPGAASSRRDLIQYLAYLKEIGVSGLRIGPATAGAARRTGDDGAGPAEAEAGRKGSPGETLHRLQVKEIGDCRRCGLCKERKNIVFGVGDPAARLMFVGEGPGRDEDLQGIPFVGRAGQLLTDIIRAMKLTRDQVYIANVVKCRPPKNRAPLPEEVEACIGFLHQQIEIISPEVIVCLGAVAAQNLLRTSTGITRLRGEFQEFHGIPVMATYHPAYLLRSPNKKRDVWRDMKAVMARLGL